MSEQPTREITRILPSVDKATRMSAALCGQVFDDLEMAVNLLDAEHKHFNRLQRQLIERFTATCKVFCRDMMAADGDLDALGAVLGVHCLPKGSCTQPIESVAPTTEPAPISAVCTESPGKL